MDSYSTEECVSRSCFETRVLMGRMEAEGPLGTHLCTAWDVWSSVKLLMK